MKNQTLAASGIKNFIFIFFLLIFLSKCQNKEQPFEEIIALKSWFTEQSCKFSKKEGIDPKLKRELESYCDLSNPSFYPTLVLLWDQENQRQVMFADQSDAVSMKFTNQYCQGNQVCFDGKCYCGFSPSIISPDAGFIKAPNFSDWFSREVKWFLKKAELKPAQRKILEIYLTDTHKLIPLVIIQRDKKTQKSIGTCIGSDLPACEALAISCTGGTGWCDPNGFCYCVTEIEVSNNDSDQLQNR